MLLFLTAVAHYYVCKVYPGYWVQQQLLLCRILYDYATFFDIWIISMLGLLLQTSGVPTVSDSSTGRFYTSLLYNQIIFINIYDMKHIIITAGKEMQ